MKIEKKLRSSCLGNGHLTISERERKSQLQLADTLSDFTKIVYLLLALQWKQTKKLFPITDQKKTVHSFFLHFFQRPFSFLILPLILIFFFVLLVLHTIWCEWVRVRVRVSLCVYIKSMVKISVFALASDPATNKKVESNLCVVYDFVLSYFRCAPNTTIMARTDGIIYSMICAFHFIDANPSLSSSASAREIVEFRFEN